MGRTPAWGIAAATVASAFVLRDVAMRGAGVPKTRLSRARARRNRVRWYNRGNRAAKRALELGQGIKAGTIDFIYGKPQDQGWT